MSVGNGITKQIKMATGCFVVLRKVFPIEHKHRVPIKKLKREASGVRDSRDISRRRKAQFKQLRESRDRHFVRAMSGVDDWNDI
jgi:hypothetical protein